MTHNTKRFLLGMLIHLCALLVVNAATMLAFRAVFLSCTSDFGRLASFLTWLVLVALTVAIPPEWFRSGKEEE